MKVYILLGYVDYEGDTVLEVFSNESDANKIMEESKAKDTGEFPDYDSYFIEEYNVTESTKKI